MFFETKIMGDTAYLAMIQKTNIDALHKEGKSQRVITERGGLFKEECCIKVFYIQSWLEGRNWVVKCAQATGMTASLRILSSKADSNTWGSFTRSELKLESVHQESPRSDVFRNRNIIRSILPGLRRERTGLLLCGNFAFNLEIKVPESGGREERHSIHVAWSPVWSFHSQWWFGLPCHLLVLVHCVFWSPVNAVIYQEILEHFMLPSADKLYGDADFIFQQDLAPAHTAKGTESWFSEPWCYCAWLASKLAWPEPNRESMGYCQEEDERHQTQQCRWPEGCYQSNLGFRYTWAVSQADCLHATLNWCSNSCKRRPNKVLGA